MADRVSPVARVLLAGVALALIAMAATAAYQRVRYGGLIQVAAPSAPAEAASGASGAPGSASIPSMPAGPEQEATLAAMQRLQADPNDVNALLALADLFMNQQNWGTAQGFVNRAMVAAPSDARPLYYQGVLYARQDKYKEAAEAMQRSLELRDEPATRYSLGIIQIYHLNDAARGRALLEGALQSPDLHPDLKVMIETELAKPQP